MKTESYCKSNLLFDSFSKLKMLALLQKRYIFILFTSGLITLVFVVVPLNPVDAVCSANPGVSSLITRATATNLYILWEEETGYYDNPATGNHTLFFKTLGDGGKTLGRTENLYRSNSVCSSGSQLTVGQDGKGKENVYALWFASNKLLFSASKDNGMSFAGPIEVGTPNSSVYELVADENNGVYIVFSGVEPNSGKSQVILRKSNNGGTSFSDNLTLSTGSEANVIYSHIGLAVSGQNVYVAWTETTTDNSCGSPLKPNCPSMIKFVKSSDGGNTFNNPELVANVKSNVSDNTTSNATEQSIGTGSSISTTCSSPQFENIAAVGQNVYLTWRNANCSLNFVHSEDNANTFTKPMNLLDDVKLTPDSFLYSSPYMLAFDNDSVYIAFIMGNSTGYDIVLLKSSDRGNHFLPIPSAIPNGFGNMAYPIPEHLAISKNGQLHFVWSPNADSRTILFDSVHANQTAASVKPTAIISSVNTPFFQYYPQLAATDNGYIYVLWFNSTHADSVSGSSPKENIEIKVSTDNGKTFGDATKVQEILAVPEFDGFSSFAFMIGTAASVTGTAFMLRRFRLRKESG